MTPGSYVKNDEKRTGSHMIRDIVDRLRNWSIAVDAAPASDLMEEAADEIERLRSRPCPYVTGTVTRYCTLNTSETPNGSTLTDAEREAIEYFSDFPFSDDSRPHPATLRSLLERLR